MIELGIGLPGSSVADVRASAEAAAHYPYASFSVYGDLGDLPPYAVLHASAEALKDAAIPLVGPMGIPVGLLHPEVIASHAIALEQQLPNRSYVGLVRGAFLEQIGAKPASLERLEKTVEHLRMRFEGEDIEPPIYIGGFGPRLLNLAGSLKVAGVKLGGSVNPVLAEQARHKIGNDDTKIVLGAVSVIDEDRSAARLRARQEVAKYLAVVGKLDHTLPSDELESLGQFNERFALGDAEAYRAISDALLDKFALAGTADDAIAQLKSLDGIVDRFELGTPHGLGDRPAALSYIGERVLKEVRS